MAMAMDGYFFMSAITPYSIFDLIILIIFALSHLLVSGELSLFLRPILSLDSLPVIIKNNFRRFGHKKAE